jgi:hypothetical protein
MKFLQKLLAVYDCRRLVLPPQRHLTVSGRINRVSGGDVHHQISQNLHDVSAKFL